MENIYLQLDSSKMDECYFDGKVYRIITSHSSAVTIINDQAQTASESVYPTPNPHT